MPAPARYPTPPAQLATALRLCRLAGMGFEEAWDSAIRGRPEMGLKPLRWPHDTEVRQGWRRALRQTLPEWQACYDGEPTPTGDLFRLLPAGLEREGGGGLLLDGDPVLQVA